MNPTISKNIAELQLMERRRVEFAEPRQAVDETGAVKSVVEKIAKFRLGRKLDKHDDRTGWFNCTDQDGLVRGLRPSEEQAKFLGARALKLRVMTALEEGPKARSIDLFAVKDPVMNVPEGHLFHALAVTPEDTEDGVHQIYVGELVLPGSPEFEDIRAIVDGFSTTAPQ